MPVYPGAQYIIANSLTDNGNASHMAEKSASRTCLSQSLGGDRSVSLMTVKAFTEHVLAGNLRPAGKLLAY
jgi:hypothetical protein